MCVCVCVCVCVESQYFLFIYFFFSSQQQHQQQLAHVSTPKWEKTKIMNSEGCTVKYTGCSSQLIIKWVLYTWDKIAYNNLCYYCCVSGFMYINICHINICTVTNKFILFTELPAVEGTALPTSLVRTTDSWNQKNYGRAISLKIYYNKM